MEDIEKLLGELNTLVKNKKFRTNALQLRGKIVHDGMTLSNSVHDLITFERFLRSPDRDPKKSKDYMVEWFLETSIYEDKTNIGTILDPLMKFMETVLSVIEFAEKAQIDEKNTWWGYFYDKKEVDYSYLKTCIKDVKAKIEDRKINMNKDNFVEKFPEFFDVHKLTVCNAYLEKIHKLCVHAALHVNYIAF